MARAGIWLYPRGHTAPPTRAACAAVGANSGGVRGAVSAGGFCRGINAARGLVATIICERAAVAA